MRRWARKSIRFHSPLSIFGSRYAASVTAEQAQPLPPEWVSCFSGSKISIPQS